MLSKKKQLTRNALGAALVFAFSATPVAFAADKGFYGIVELGQSEVDISAPAGVSVDNKDTSYSLGAGYRFNDYVSVEGGYLDLGEVSASGSGTLSGTYYGTPFTATGTFSAQSDAKGWFLGPKFTLPLSKQMDLYGKVGYYFWDSDTTATFTGSVTFGGVTYSGGGSAKVTDSGDDPYYGLGLAYRFTDRIGIQAGFTRYSVQDTDVDNLALGLTFKF